MSAKPKSCVGCKYPEYYVNQDCLNLCQSCLVVAPDNLAEDGETIKVEKQPQTDEEAASMDEAQRICPADAIKVKNKPKG